MSAELEPIETTGSDKILGFYSRENSGLGLEKVTIIKGSIRLHYKRDLWGIFLDPEHPNVVRVIFRQGRKKPYQLYREFISYDADTKIIISAGPLPKLFWTKHPQLTPK